MAKLRKIVDDLFLVEKENSRENLKLFYNVDILIHNPNNQVAQQNVATNATNVAQQAPEVIQKQKNESYRDRIHNILSEEDPVVPAAAEQPAVAPVTTAPAPTGNDFAKKSEGVLSVSTYEVENIQTLEDLIDFVSDKKEKGNQIFDEVAVELILAMAGISETPLEQIVTKNDKVIIDVNYGSKMNNSVGFKVLKRSGVNNVSIVMKKDGQVVNAPFDLKIFNSQLVELRNEMIGK